MKPFLILDCLALLFLVQGCSSNRLILHTGSNELSVQAVIDPTVRSFPEGKKKINGKVTVTNRTPMQQFYGNEFLLLQINETAASRTFYDSVASRSIDVAPAAIAPAASITLPAYWVYQERDMQSTNRFSLILNAWKRH